MQIPEAIRLVREACAARYLSVSTEKTYTHWLGRYATFLKDPKLKTLTSDRKFEAFLTRLAMTGVSASTQNQAFNALLFFYRDVLKQQLGPIAALRAKRPPAIRRAPAPEEVRSLLASVSDLYRYPTRLIVHLLYACGLRLCEPLNLRIKDVDLRHPHSPRRRMRARRASRPRPLASRNHYALPRRRSGQSGKPAARLRPRRRRADHSRLSFATSLV